MFLIAAMAIVAFSATVAFAEEEQKTKGFLTAVVVTFGVYDQRCEKLPRQLRVDLRRILRALDKGDVRAGSLREQEKVDADPAMWCAMRRQLVEKYKDGLLKPVPPRGR